MNKGTITENELSLYRKLTDEFTKCFSTILKDELLEKLHPEVRAEFEPILEQLVTNIEKIRKDHGVEPVQKGNL